MERSLPLMAFCTIARTGYLMNVKIRLLGMKENKSISQIYSTTEYVARSTHRAELELIAIYILFCKKSMSGSYFQ